MKKLLLGLFLLAGCASNEVPPQEPICYKIFEPTDAHGIAGHLRGDFPSLSNARLYLGYHNPGSFVVALYRVDSEDRRDATWHHVPVQKQTVRCYRMSDGTVMHSLEIAPLEAECPCGLKDEPR